jgi:hypothetical protein
MYLGFVVRISGVIIRFRILTSAVCAKMQSVEAMRDTWDNMFLCFLINSLLFACDACVL